MLSDVKLPEALVLLVADRADRVASVDWVCCVQDEAMLRETAVPAVQVRPVLVHCLVFTPPEAEELEKANAVRANAEIQTTQRSLVGSCRPD